MSILFEEFLKVFQKLYVYGSPLKSLLSEEMVDFLKILPKNFNEREVSKTFPPKNTLSKESPSMHVYPIKSTRGQ